MGAVTRPRGRLPRRVYWMRRGIVLATALLLVFAVGKLVGGLGADPAEQAVTTGTDTGATVSDPTSAGVPAATGAPIGPVAPPRKVLRQQRSAAVQATPEGDCVVDEVSVLPTVPQAQAGGKIPIVLQLLGTQPACNFDVSPDTLVVKVAQDGERVWSSQDCPAAIPAGTVVVRSGIPVAVPVTWNGRTSDEECSKSTGWVGPGFYQVYAAALGSAPSDVQFEVTLPQARVRTKTIQPKPQGKNPGPSPSDAGRSPTKPTPSR